LHQHQPTTNLTLSRNPTPTSSQFPPEQKLLLLVLQHPLTLLLKHSKLLLYQLSKVNLKMEKLMTISKPLATQPLTKSRRHCLKERLLSGHYLGPTKANPELTRPRNVTTLDPHQLNLPGCLTPYLASQKFLLQDRQQDVGLHSYLLDTTLASVVILLSMDDLIDPARPCAPIPLICREKRLL
jgi:hypothetical protein